MTERIIDMPDDCLYEWQDVYYPDERDDQMAVREEIVRCGDCKWMSKDTVHYKACYRLHAIEFMVEPDGFCAWGIKKGDDR